MGMQLHQMNGVLDRVDRAIVEMYNKWKVPKNYFHRENRQWGMLHLRPNNVLAFGNEYMDRHADYTKSAIPNYEQSQTITYFIDCTNLTAFQSINILVQYHILIQLMVDATSSTAEPIYFTALKPCAYENQLSGCRINLYNGHTYDSDGNNNHGNQYGALTSFVFSFTDSGLTSVLCQDGFKDTYATFDSYSTALQAIRSVTNRVSDQRALTRASKFIRGVDPKSFWRNRADASEIQLWNAIGKMCILIEHI